MICCPALYYLHEDIKDIFDKYFNIDEAVPPSQTFLHGVPDGERVEVQVKDRTVGQGELDHVLGGEISLVLVVAGVHGRLQSHHVLQLHLSVQRVPPSLHLGQAVVQVQDVLPGRVAVVVVVVVVAVVVAVVVVVVVVVVVEVLRFVMIPIISELAVVLVGGVGFDGELDDVQHDWDGVDTPPYHVGCLHPPADQAPLQPQSDLRDPD